MLRHVASQGCLFAGFSVVFSVVELTIIMRYAFKYRATFVTHPIQAINTHSTIRLLTACLIKTKKQTPSSLDF